MGNRGGSLQEIYPVGKVRDSGVTTFVRDEREKTLYSAPL